jgi:hypothetical protein
MVIAATMLVATSSLMPLMPIKPKLTKMVTDKGTIANKPAQSDLKKMETTKNTMINEAKIFHIWVDTIKSTTPFSIKAKPASSTVTPAGKLSAT